MNEMRSASGDERLPTVTVAVPVLDEESHIGSCLKAIEGQTYPAILEILVVDGGSKDRTREFAMTVPLVRLLDNPRRSRPSGLNVAVWAARGDIFVRVDARAEIASDYVEQCVAALRASSAAIVGGTMKFSAEGAVQRGIRAAMTSRIGAGPAAFRRQLSAPQFVDTVYLGAFRTDTVRALGGYDEWFGGNEDAELNFRAQHAGGVYLDPAIRSRYAVREGFAALWRQFRRWGTARAVTIRKHPASLSGRQLAVPALLIGVLTPWRRFFLSAYIGLVAGRAALEARRDPWAAPAMLVALPTMHVAWGIGFLTGIPRRRHLGPDAAADLRGGN